MSNSDDIIDLTKKTLKEMVAEQGIHLGALVGKVDELNKKVTKLEADLIRRNALSEEREKRQKASIAITTALGAFLGYIIHTIVMVFKE